MLAETLTEQFAAKPIEPFALRLPVHPDTAPNITRAIGAWDELTPAQFFGWLLYLAGQNHSMQHKLLKELRRMATNDAQLTTADQDLLAAFANYATAQNSYTAQLLSEISNLKATVVPETDPAITDAVGNLQSIVAQMNQATASIQAAMAPAPAVAADPTQGSASGSSTGVSSSSSSTAASGDVSSSPAGGSDAGTSATPGSSPAPTAEATPATATS